MKEESEHPLKLSVGVSGGGWGDSSNSVERGAQRLEGRASGLPEGLGTQGLAAASRLAPPVGVESQPAKAVARSQPVTEHQPEAPRPSRARWAHPRNCSGRGVPGRGSHSSHSWRRGRLSKRRRPAQNATSLLPSEASSRTPPLRFRFSPRRPASLGLAARPWAWPRPWV